MAKVGVIGAGIIGLSSAVALQQRLPGVHVTVMADSFTVDTTSDGAGGMFVPDAPGADIKLIRKWGQEGARYFYDLAFSEHSNEAGVYLSHGYELSTESNPMLPVCVQFALSHRRLNVEEIKQFQPHYKDGFFFTTVIIEGRKYLPWITKRFTENGGVIETRRIENLDELSGQYDVVVNCSGLGSIKLASDSKMKPVRGQILRVHAPWIKFFVHTHDGFYIMPSGENVALGVTKELDVTDKTPSRATSQLLYDRAVTRVPAMKGAKKLWDWVGIRPYRCPPRVDSEVRKCANGKSLKVVHNYGHGSHGISLSWGTGVHVAHMVSDMLNATSKL